MAPCSYVNDSTTEELGSLLLVKVRVSRDFDGESDGIALAGSKVTTNFYGMHLLSTPASCSTLSNAEEARK
jgi:hypothetical protein